MNPRHGARETRKPVKPQWPAKDQMRGERAGDGETALSPGLRGVEAVDTGAPEDRSGLSRKMGFYRSVARAPEAVRKYYAAGRDDRGSAASQPATPRESYGSSHGRAPLGINREVTRCESLPLLHRATI